MILVIMIITIAVIKLTSNTNENISEKTVITKIICVTVIEMIGTRDAVLIIVIPIKTIAIENNRTTMKTIETIIILHSGSQQVGCNVETLQRHRLIWRTLFTI